MIGTTLSIKREKKKNVSCGKASPQICIEPSVGKCRSSFEPVKGRKRTRPKNYAPVDKEKKGNREQRTGAAVVFS